MPRSVKVPRASIACTILRDPKYLELITSDPKEGAQAMWVFTALLCAAKDADNGGIFDVSHNVLSALTGIELNLLNGCLCILWDANFIELDEPNRGDVVIQNFAKWNPKETRGGAREGAGRPVGTKSNQKESTDIQTESAPLPLPLPSPIPSKEKISSDLAEPGPEPVIVLPCTGSGLKEYPVTALKVEEWGEAYPGVDVMAQLLQARQWLRDNPKRQKTYRGMSRYLGSWLSRQQDSPGNGPGSGSNGSGQKPSPSGVKAMKSQAERVLERMDAEEAQGAGEPRRLTGGE